MLNNKIGLRGEFHLRVVNAETGRLRAERHFQNLIVNVGLENFAKGAPGGDAMYCAVGKGTSTPSVTDTTISNQRAQVQMYESGRTNPVAPNYEYSASRSGRFAAGAISDTISEIGIFYIANGVMWCRQLILDEQGQPSTIAVLPNEYLDVTYTLWYYPPLQDRQFQFVMNGQQYSCVSRCALLPAYSAYNNSFVAAGSSFSVDAAYETQTLGGITSAPAGAGYGYVIGSNYAWNGAGEPYSWSGTVAFALDNFNVPGGIGSLLIRHYASLPDYQISFNPKLPKNANVEMSLVLSESIGRYGE